MKILRIIGLALVVVVLAAALGIFVFYNDLTRSPLPQHEGTLSLPGLTGEVEILRDAHGIPHIYASNPYDLFFAQGVTQAQDRWWQMEFARHIGSGTLQELTGQNEALMGTDVFIRTAERDYAAADEATLAVVQAFADGVNAYLNSRGQHQLALEYRLLGLTGNAITIAPWTPVDSIVWGKVLAWNLSSTYASDIANAAVLEALGQDMLDDYFPPWPYDNPDKPTILTEDDLPLTDASAGDTASAWAPLARIAEPRMAGNIVSGELAFLGAGVGRERGLGSNNWVSTGAMTESGTPLLANDPHLGIQMPAIWYEIGLHCQPVTEACPYDVRGFSLPPSPGVVIGHNARIAWGVTNAGPDVQDIYTIEVNPDNPLQYRYNDAWLDFTIRDETVNFADGGAPVAFQVRETVWGPVINDNQLDDAGALTGFNNDDPVALRYTGSDTGSLVRSLVLLNQAGNWTEFRDALRFWDIPAQNFVYADVDGNIGYQMPGNVPIRAPGDDGRLPKDGTSDALAWQGYIPFDDLPRIFNPARDYIATANQAIVPLSYYARLEESLGADASYLISYDFAYGQRGQRIVSLMEQLAPLNSADYRAIHADSISVNALETMTIVRNIDFGDDGLNDYRDWLAGWDGSFDADSPQAALFAAFGAHLIDNLFTDQLPEDVGIGNGLMFAAIQLLDEPDNVWWDNASTEAVETRDAIVRASLEEAVAQITRLLGADRAGWRWGALHTSTFVSNPLGLSGIGLIEDMVNRGPTASPGGDQIVNATGWDAFSAVAADDFGLTSLPSMRMIVDVANFDASLSIITTGQSGHPFSPHYADQIAPWTNVDYHPMLFTRAAVEASAASRLVLQPAG
jgi:penicillin G amidase